MMIGVIVSLIAVSVIAGYYSYSYIPSTSVTESQAIAQQGGRSGGSPQCHTIYGDCNEQVCQQSNFPLGVCFYTYSNFSVIQTWYQNSTWDNTWKVTHGLDTWYPVNETTAEYCRYGVCSTHLGDLINLTPNGYQRMSVNNTAFQVAGPDDYGTYSIQWQNSTGCYGLQFGNTNKGWNIWSSSNSEGGTCGEIGVSVIPQHPCQGIASGNDTVCTSDVGG